MLRLRPYKPGDAGTIISWCKDETEFRKWTSDRYDSFPVTADDINGKYFGNNGDCTEADNFYPMTAFDENGIVGHLIMRYTDKEKKTLRFGFVIVDSSKRGCGYGKEMIMLSIKYAFEIFKADKITIGVFENNMPAYHCYKSAGFSDNEADNSVCELFGEKWKVLELQYKKEDYKNC
ncbi:MAG: GNAT family N-acetyltransferase [Ruminiclostridium sp.]|nr:GNAT family N-acetyltransferase [Ruminiclostridium sp.]